MVVTQHIVGGRYAGAILGELRDARCSRDRLGGIGFGGSGPD